MSLCIKSNPKQHQKYFKTSSVNQLISSLKISPHPAKVYHHLSKVSLNTEFRSYKLCENSKKCNRFFLNLWEKGFWNFKMKHCISKSNCLKSWNTSSSSQKMLFDKFVLLVFLGRVCGIFVNRHANGKWSFSFLHSITGDFFRLCLKAPLGDCI